MDWLTSFKKAIDYMETHMLSDISAKDVADGSPLQKNPKSPADKTVLDLACKYGYDTPESFTKAFSRFHGMSPTITHRRISPPISCHYLLCCSPCCT